MFRIYLSIDGETFDAGDFSRKTGGRVAFRKRLGDGRTEAFGAYWSSVEVAGVPGDLVDSHVQRLLSQYRDAVVAVSHQPGVRVMLEIVQEYRGPDSVAGLFLSRETLRLVADMQANLDVDIAQDLS
jgi:hypothetical protein